MALPPARALPHGSGTARSKAVAPSGAETLQLEPVTLPAVSRLQSLGGLSTSIPEVDLGGLSLSYSSIGNTGGVRLWPCSPFVTLVSGLIILLSFPGLSDPWASGQLAPWRHSPEAQVTAVKLLPEVRSRQGAGTRGLPGGSSLWPPLLPPKPPKPMRQGHRLTETEWWLSCWGWAGGRESCLLSPQTSAAQLACPTGLPAPS